METKKIFLLLLFVTCILSTGAQNKVGDNPAMIQAGSLLELESLTKGLRLPRIPLNNVAQWTLDGTPASGMMIFNETGSEPKGIYYWSTDSSQWIRVVNKSELSTLIANYFNQNTTVRDSIVKLINTTITSGTLKGKDVTSNSSVIKVMNGTGAAIKAVQVDLDKNELGHLLNTAPLTDSLSVAISNSTIIRDSIKSVVNNTIVAGDIKGKDVTSNSSVIKVMNGTGAAIKAVQVDLDKNELGHLLNTAPLTDSLSVAISNSTIIRDSIKSVVNNTIVAGDIKGKDVTSNSSVIKVVNGTGAAIKAVQVDLDKNELGHLLNTAPLTDSLSVVISNSTVIRDSIKSVVNATTTNTLVGISGKLTSTVNGVPAELTPSNGTIAKSLGFDASGNLVTAGSTPTSNTLDNTTNTITSNVNGVVATAPAVNTVANTSSGNLLSTAVNGIPGAGVKIINGNTLSLTNGVLTSTVNGVTSSPGVNLISSTDNGLSSENGNAQLGGTLIKPTGLVTSAANTLSITGLQDGDIATDGLLVVNSGTGIIRQISGGVPSTGVCKLIAFASADGQKRFATPIKITDIKKLQVYRNGINVEFSQVDDTHIDLEDGASCYADDEIKIIQLK